jgi:hypothetical protein
MLSPQQLVRRDVRYPLHLPVSVRLAGKEMHAQSENISLHGILLASAFLIPEGSTVELAVAVGRMPNPAVFMTSRGKVVRVRMKDSGDFTLAIECERPFGLTRGSSNFAEYL